jgi:hypothetical protein
MAPQLTEERLRSWLDSKQVDRERMCLALLTLDHRFANPRPRRPKGGPDGARDIELAFNGMEAWGAVGFRNSANDSHEDKAWVKKKFQFDLESALKENRELRSFVFLTNIDLTPAELRALVDFASTKSILQCEIFYRERIRHLLDAPAGLGLRFQYLGIPLSEAEQVAFFERFGSQLEQLMLKKFDDVDKKLARIEFFHDCARPLMGIDFFVELARQYTPAELGHFRVLIEIINLHEREPHPTLWLACRDSYLVSHGVGGETLLFANKSLAWSRNPDEVIQSTVFSQSLVSTDYFSAGAHVHKRGPYSTMGSLDGRKVWVFVTRPLFDALAGIGFRVGDYLLTGSHIDNLECEAREPLASWLEPLTEPERAVPWVNLRAKREPNQHPMFWPTAWSLDFTNFTPEKLEK